MKPTRGNPWAMFRATVGRKRIFVLEADARAYERGYNNWPRPPQNYEQGSPELTGYYDAESYQLDNSKDD